MPNTENGIILKEPSRSQEIRKTRIRTTKRIEFPQQYKSDKKRKQKQIRLRPPSALPTTPVNSLYPLFWLCFCRALPDLHEHYEDSSSEECEQRILWRRQWSNITCRGIQEANITDNQCWECCVRKLTVLVARFGFETGVTSFSSSSAACSLLLRQNTLIWLLGTHLILLAHKSFRLVGSRSCCCMSCRIGGLSRRLIWSAS